jgi:hypothetical protein
MADADRRRGGCQVEMKGEWWSLEMRENSERIKKAKEASWVRRVRCT